jgi:hypothetical protein
LRGKIPFATLTMVNILSPSTHHNLPPPSGAVLDLPRRVSTFLDDENGDGCVFPSVGANITPVSSLLVLNFDLEGLTGMKVIVSEHQRR